MKLARVVVAASCAMLCALLVGCVAGNSAGDAAASKPGSAGKESDSPTGEKAYLNSNQEDCMFITVNGNRLQVRMEDNSSARALVELLRDGAITFKAEDYGGFEKVGSLGCSLPTNDEQIDTEPGDVILYQGSRICIYYGENSWSFTRLGRIADASDLRKKLGKESVEVTLSLA